MYGKPQKLEYLPFSASSTVRKHAVSLLRALLHECRYLPDPQSRSYWSQYVRSRYRKYNNSALDPHALERNKQTITPRRQTKLLSDARKLLTTLKGANEGELKPLRKVLLHTYGRAGKRRRELLEVVLQPDPPQNTQELCALVDQGQSKLAEGRWTPRLRALVKSQIDASIPVDGKGALRLAEPKIPEKNVWARPTPKKRVKNITKKHMREHILSRVHAPLPDEEWRRLKELATGERRWEGPVPRIRKPIEESGKNHLWKEPPTADKRQPHAITTRLMRRLWAQIFSMCPVMRWDSSKKEWTVEWGKAVNEDVTRQTVTRDVNHSMFTGVDHKGRIFQNPSRLTLEPTSFEDREDQPNQDIKNPAGVS